MVHCDESCLGCQRQYPRRARVIVTPEANEWPVGQDEGAVMGAELHNVPVRIDEPATDLGIVDHALDCRQRMPPFRPTQDCDASTEKPPQRNESALRRILSPRHALRLSAGRALL